MSIQELIAILITLTAVCSYINYRFIKLPTSIGVTLIALIISTVVLLFSQPNTSFTEYINKIADSTDFSTTFMGGMISFLLFAGALHINVLELFKHKTAIATLATIGVIISTTIVGLLIWVVINFFGIELKLIDCLIFGALIAPTDPIAVLGIFKKISVPKALEMKIAGESLFNDGMGIILFVTLLNFALDSRAPESWHIAIQFIQLLGGGLIYGLVLGYLVGLLLKKVNDFNVAALITLATVTGGYLMALKLNVSGPIAIVIAGLVIGSSIRSGLMSENCINQLDNFWVLVDEVLNAILFVLIGLELISLPLNKVAFVTAAAAIPIVLLARYISVAAPIAVLKPFHNYGPKTVGIMTWGGLRGGVSIALALSLQTSLVKDEIITVTYAVVVFSLIVQGLTIGPYIRYALRKTNQSHD